MSNTAASAIPPTVEEARKTHHEPIVRNPSEYEKEIGRFASTQMVFHPTPDDPTAPNAGVLTYSAGSGFPLHKHDFAQVWYVIEGECDFGGNRLKEGDIVYLQDPHFEHQMHTVGGCKILFVQYQGPTTGARPIYDGRFNQQVRRPIEQEDLDH